MCIDRMFLPNFARLFTFFFIRNEKLNSLILPNTSARTFHIRFKELLSRPLSACSVPIATVPSLITLYNVYRRVCLCAFHRHGDLSVCLIMMFALFIFSNLLISSLHFLITPPSLLIYRTMCPCECPVTLRHQIFVLSGVWNIHYLFLA